MARRAGNWHRTRGNSTAGAPLATLASGSALVPPPISPTPASSPRPTVTDAQLERLLDGISDDRLAIALGPRLDIFFADRLDDILMSRLQQLAPGFLGTIDLAPLVERHLDTLLRDFESTWTSRIDMASSVLREQATRLQDQAIQSTTTVSNDALAKFGLASAAAQALVEQMNERHRQLTSLADMIAQNAGYIDAQDRLAARLDTMAADLSKLQSDCVRHGHFDATTKFLQGQILEISLRLARTLDDHDPDGPPRRPGRTPTRGRSDQNQRHHLKKFENHYGLVLSDFAPWSVRIFYNLLYSICRSCNLPLLQLDSIVATTTDLCPTNVPGPERQQHSMDLYFKLASHGVLPKSKHTDTWLNMFAMRADGYALLYELCHHAIPALSLTVPVFPTWDDYPDVYLLAAAAMDFFQTDTSHGNTRKSPRLQSELYLSAIKDDSLAANVNLMRDRLWYCDHDHSIPPDLLLASLPVTLRPWKQHEPRHPDSITTVEGRIRFSAGF
jgi:hypothetical protein